MKGYLLILLVLIPAVLSKHKHHHGNKHNNHHHGNRNHHSNDVDSDYENKHYHGNNKNNEIYNDDGGNIEKFKDQNNFPDEDEGSIGFNLLFTSNLQEYNEKEIFFDNPIPKWLQGSFVKNGPSRFEFGHRNVTHGFDGYAKLRKIRFHPNGQVTFSSRFVESESYRKSMLIDDIAPYMLFEQPHPKFNFFQKFESISRNMDNMNVNIYQFKKGEDHVVIQDVWNMYTINITNLSTKEKIFPPVPGGSSLTEVVPPMSSSHPMPEYGTDNWITFSNMMRPNGATLSLMRITSTKERELIAEIETKQLHYMHCFGMTRNYAILMAQPIYFNIFTFVEKFEPLDALTWVGDDPMLIFVINLKTGKVHELKTKPRLINHHINGYETKDGAIVVDFATFSDDSVLKSFEVDRLRDPRSRNEFPVEKADLRRYTIRLDTGEVTESAFPFPDGMRFTNKMDFPKINENFMYKPYCYTYGLSLKADDIAMANFKLIKKNVCDSQKDLYWYESNHYPSEPVFVPRPNSLKEDDGLLLSVILDGKNQKSYVGIFDPTTMKLINKAHLPSAEPFFFHGRFFD